MSNLWGKQVIRLLMWSLNQLLGECASAYLAGED